MSPGPVEAGNWLAAVARGDRTAFRALYDATSPKLLGVILRIVKTRAEAEEVLQDVYIRIWNNAGRFDATAGTPAAWMTSIARNRAIDIVRVKTPVTFGASREEEDSDWLERVSDGRDIGTEIANREALLHCLSTVEPQTRDMILRAYCNGDSREELADRYERPVNTIKTLLHRGLASLKVCLDERT